MITGTASRKSQACILKNNGFGAVPTKLLRKRTEKIIPELLNIKSNNQELIDASLSFGFYQRLKFQGLDKSNIYKLINEQCKKLIMSGGE